MFWKIIVRLLRCRNRNYIKAIPMKEGIYIVDIYRFCSCRQGTGGKVGEVREDG